MARSKAVFCLALIACAAYVATAQTEKLAPIAEPAPEAAVAPAKPAAPAAKPAAAAAKPAAPAAKPAGRDDKIPKNSEGGLEKGLQDAVSRASQVAAEGVIKKGGTKEQANAAAAKAAQEVLNAARSGKALPSRVTALTPDMQSKVAAASQKAAEAVVKRGGSQADANAAGAKAAKEVLTQYGFN